MSNSLDVLEEYAPETPGAPKAPELEFQINGHRFELPWFVEEIGRRKPNLYEFEWVITGLKEVMLQIETLYPPTRYKDSYATFLRQMRGTKKQSKAPPWRAYDPETTELPYAQWYLSAWVSFLMSGAKRVKPAKKSPTAPIATSEASLAGGLFDIF